MEILKVSAKSNPNSVAGALAGVLREKGGAEIQAIGAGALNQAIKSIAIARGFVAPGGIDLVCVPAFTDIEIDYSDGSSKLSDNLVCLLCTKCFFKKILSILNTTFCNILLCQADFIKFV